MGRTVGNLEEIVADLHRRDGERLAEIKSLNAILCDLTVKYGRASERIDHMNTALNELSDILQKEYDGLKARIDLLSPPSPHAFDGGIL